MTLHDITLHYITCILVLVYTLFALIQHISKQHILGYSSFVPPGARTLWQQMRQDAVPGSEAGHGFPIPLENFRGKSSKWDKYQKKPHLSLVQRLTHVNPSD